MIPFHKFLMPTIRGAETVPDHRQRLRARFLEGGAAALPDYELLELVLFRAIPRRDVKPLVVIGRVVSVVVIHASEDTGGQDGRMKKPAAWTGFGGSLDGVSF